MVVMVVRRRQQLRAFKPSHAVGRRDRLLQHHQRRRRRAAQRRGSGRARHRELEGLGRDDLRTLVMKLDLKAQRDGGDDTLALWRKNLLALRKPDLIFYVRSMLLKTCI